MAHCYGQKNGPIAGATIKRLCGGSIQEWRRGEPIRLAEQQKRDFDSKVKVHSCQRPLLLLVSKALAQPKHSRSCEPRPAPAKPLQYIWLTAVHEKSISHKRGRFRLANAEFCILAAKAPPESVDRTRRK